MVRSFLHRKGFRFRLHSKDLPGKPDLVFPSLKVCVLVHGCFWHGCTKCIDGTRKVKSSVAYWTEKIAGNRARDAAHHRALGALGWTVITVWECELRHRSKLERIVARLSRKRTRRT